MTAIAIWCDHEASDNAMLWVAADSRVSGTNGTILIEDGAKIFGLPIVCRSPGDDGFFSHIYHEHTYGYCFAGSTLMGQNAFLSIMPLLSNLISPDSYIPSLSDIAQHALALFSRSFDEYKQRVGQNAVFEAAIFGYCHREQNLSAFHFSPEIGDDGIARIMLTPHQGMKDKQFIYLGDDKAVMCSLIEEAFSRESIPGRPVSRIPRYIIQDKIDDGSCGSIGGDIQLARADRFGFIPLTLCKPRWPGQPDAYMSYLGRELTPDIAWVGQAGVGMIGVV